MLSLIENWFAPPIFEGDEEKTRHASLLNASTITGLVLILLVLFGNFLDKKTPTRNFIIDILFLAAIIFFRRELYKGRIKSVGNGLLIIGFIIATATIISEGTIFSPATSSYLLLVIAAGILFGVKGVLITTIASSVCVWGLILAQNTGALLTQNRQITTIDWFAFTVLFGITGGLVSFVVQNSRKALARAEREIEARERIEIEMRKLTRATEQSPASIVITSLDGNIEYVNRRFTQVTGYSFDEAIGKNPRILKTEITSPETHRLLWETLTAGNEWHGEFTNRKKDGSIYYESATISPITDLDGVPTHYLAVKEDITNQKKVADELRINEARFRSLFEQTHDAVFILDMKGCHQAANQRAAEMLGYSVEELLGLSVHETSVETEKSLNVLERVINGERIPTYEQLLRQKNGEHLPVEINVELVKDKFGKPLHIQSIVRDISQRKYEEKKLRQQNEYLENMNQITVDLLSHHKTEVLLNNIVQYAMSLVDAQHGYIFLPKGDTLVLCAATAGFQHNLGWHEPIPGTGVLGQVWKNKKTFAVEDYSEWDLRDPNYHNQNLRAIAGTPIRIGENIMGVLEVADTRTARIFTNEELQILNHFGTLGALVLNNAQLLDSSEREVSERKFSEERLHQQNVFLSILHQITLDLLNRRYMDELLQMIVDRAVILLDAPFGELMLEKDGELIVQTFTANQSSLKGDRVGRADSKLSWSAFEKKTAVVVDDYSTYPDRRDIYSKDLLHAVADFPVLVRDQCIGILAVGRSQPGYVFSQTQINNGVLFAQLVALVLDSAQLFSAAEHEIIERKQAEESLQKANEQLQINLMEIKQLQMELQEQALHDPLTGLYNRRYLSDFLPREALRSERDNEPLSIIISDVDYFKKINDTYGHQVGDKFLVEIGNLMKTSARGSDVVCRYGGEEFLLVLPGTTVEAAAKRAEEIRQKCMKVIITDKGIELRVTMSFGVATYPTHGREAEGIIIKADKALYQSKNSGRNQVTVWSSEDNFEDINR